MKIKFTITLVLLAVGCSRKVEQEALIEHRIAPCQEFCEIQFGECVSLSVETYDDAEECTASCATPDGAASWGWGHQKDGTDACAAEFKAMTQCVVALSCEDQELYFSEEVHTLPDAERPCWTPFKSMADCQIAHPFERS